MASEKRTILRTVRVTPTLDKWIREIAENENRTVSNAIYNLLSKAILPYLTRKNSGEKLMNEISKLREESLSLNEDSKDSEDN